MELEKLNIDVLRLKHESDTEWQLRREFLQLHCQKFPLRRLVCLANCFVNIRCYGCRYPAALMSQIEELSTNLSKVTDTVKRKGRLPTITFVKSGDLSAVTEETATKSEQIADNVSVSLSKHISSNSKDITQNISTIDSSDTQAQVSAVKLEDAERKDLEAKFYLLSSALQDLTQRMKGGKNEIELIHMAVDKARMGICVKTLPALESAGFQCELVIDGVHVSSSDTASNKKSAKLNAYIEATHVLRMPYLHIDAGLRLQSSLQPPQMISAHNHQQTGGIVALGKATIGNIHALAKQTGRPVNVRPISGTVNLPTQRPMVKNATGATMHQQSQAHKPNPVDNARKRSGPPDNPLSDFVILEVETVAGNSATPAHILDQSASFNHIPLSYSLTDVSGGRTRCTVCIGGDESIVDVIGDDRISAKSLAVDRTLQRLRQLCCTIIKKRNDDADSADHIVKDALLNDGGTLGDTRIPDTNIGSKMLRKMGWTGGGVGREGREGIAEPVSLQSVINREGLGLQASVGIARDFAQRIRAAITRYLNSDKEEDMVFSPDFTKEERAVIHVEARKCRLKTKSFGREAERYLVLSRKRTPLQLVAHIRANGGTTNKYLLREPCVDMMQ